MSNSLIQTTHKYLHPLPETDQKNLDALNRIRGRTNQPPAPDS